MLFGLFKKQSQIPPSDDVSALAEEFPVFADQQLEVDGSEYPMYGQPEVAGVTEHHVDVEPAASVQSMQATVAVAAEVAAGTSEDNSEFPFAEVASAEQPTDRSTLEGAFIDAGHDEHEQAELEQTKTHPSFSIFKRRKATQRSSTPGRRPRSIGKPLPLGIDISDAGVGVVYATLGHGEFYTEDAKWISIPGALDESRRDKVIGELRAAIAELGIKERRCVVSISALDVTTRKLDIPEKARPQEISGIAEIAANKFVNYPPAERAMSLERLSATEILLSVARKSVIAYAAQIAREAGLKPISADCARFAWQRAVADADAVLDLRAPRPVLSVFAQPVDDHFEPGNTYSLSPEAADDEIAVKIGNAFLEMRRDKGFAITRLAVAADEERYNRIEAALQEIGGLQVFPVTMAGRIDCPFAVAFGLARWSLPDYGVPVAIRANLLEDRADTIKVARVRVAESTIRQALLSLAAVAAVVIGVMMLQAYRYKVTSDEVTATIQRDTFLAPRVRQAHQLAVTITALKAMIDQVRDVRSSGNTLAVNVARIGTQVSGNRHTWITSLTYDAQTGWDVQGGSTSLRSLGETATAVNHANTFTLLTTGNDPGKGVTYHAQIQSPQLAAAPQPPPPTVSTATPTPEGRQ